MCSCQGSSLFPCLDCMYQLDPVGCKHFRELYRATIVYVRIADILEDFILDTYLKDEAKTIKFWS